MGLCVGYNIVQEYEKSVLLNAPPLIQGPKCYIQFVWDNVDLNVRTLDGLNTVHIMGGIKVITPSESVSFNPCVPRIKAGTPGQDISSAGAIPLKTYRQPPGFGLHREVVQDLRPNVPCPNIILPSNPGLQFFTNATNLSLTGAAFQSSPSPGWAGFMERALEGTQEYCTSVIIPIPFINLDPGNLSTIYTALEYSVKQVENQGQDKVCVTFDQPLCHKAMEIVSSAPEGSSLKKVVVRLGGFHLLMTLMAAIGYIMSGSGIEELWATVYATNTVQIMLSGKAYARALRVHFLSQEAILRFICDHGPAGVLRTQSVRAHLSTLFQKVCSKKCDISMAAFDKTVEEVGAAIEETLSHYSQRRLGKLWSLYFRSVSLIRLFVAAERTGNWPLHVYAVRQMLPILSAAGRLNYARTAHLYLQQVLALERQMSPQEFDLFTREGFFAVRRSNKFWAGLWTDLTIEQFLMRGFHSVGGLARGRGVRESTKAVFIGTMPYCSKVIQALELYTGKRAVSSEQHVEMRESRQARNKTDIDKFVEWLKMHNPFGEPQTLRSLSSGRAADDKVNCDCALDVGCGAMLKMVGKNFKELTLHRKDRVVNLASVSNTIRIHDDEDVHVNTNTLFHRITAVVESNEELQQCFSFELAPIPCALFDDNGMRKGTKSTLIKALEEFCAPQPSPPPDVLYVLDGGLLLHRVVWGRPCTYEEVIDGYCKYVVRHYTCSATVVFDGYTETPSTKDAEHQRRTARTTSADFPGFEPSMQVPAPQAAFLSNGKNKARLISFIATALRTYGVRVQQAPADGDRLIATTAIDMSVTQDKEVVAVSEDTDVLVILTSLNTSSPVQFLSPATTKSPAKCFDVRKLRAELGETCEVLLFIHAVSGCDTTSALQGKGKIQPLKKLHKSKQLQDLARIFYRYPTSPSAVAAAGEKIILALYNMEKFETLDEARYPAYLKAVSRRAVDKEIDLSLLPPTSAAALQHSLRVYHQVQAWLGNDLPPHSWGWRLNASRRLTPITTLLPAAPERVLKLTACKCASDCSKRTCSCRKVALRCLPVCSNCKGECTNSAERIPIDAEDLTGEEVDDPTFEWYIQFVT